MATPIVESITANVVTTLQGVTVAGGYDNTLTVERPNRQGNNIRDRLVIVNQGDPIRADSEAIGHIDWLQPYLLVCHVVQPEASATAIDTDINSVRSDIEKALMVDPHRNNLAIDTMIGSHQMVEFESGGAEGLVMLVTVHYRVLIGNPYSQ